MIVDTSALLAVYFTESLSKWAADQMLYSPTPLQMSTVNLAECLMLFAARRSPSLQVLSERLFASEIEFIAPDRDQSIMAADARDRFPLNLGDCFAYSLAKTLGEPLLTLDQDFRSTDIEVILPTR